VTWLKAIPHPSTLAPSRRSSTTPSASGPPLQAARFGEGQAGSGHSRYRNAGFFTGFGTSPVQLKTIGAVLFSPFRVIATKR
jgi:hypothetical protein